jgi:membrane associated rhomboid family serine protease
MSSILDDLKMQYQFGGIAFKLIFWNVLCFLVSVLFFYQFQLGIFNFPNWIALSSDPTIFITQPWTLISYAFFHHGFGHLFFNMMVLHFSSMLFLTFFNSKQFLGLYLLSALFSGIAFVTGYYFLHLSSSMVGASAAIMAILVATTTYRPLMNVRLILLGNVKLWHITAVILVLDFMQFKIQNTGGN